MAKKRILAIGGDGVGPEVVDATCYVLEKAKFDLEIRKPPEPPPDEPYNEEALRKMCNEADAVLFGAAGPAPGRPNRGGIMIYLRWILDNYVNIRPIKYYRGAGTCLKDASGIDLVILRENSEGMYSFFEEDLSVLKEALPNLRNRFNKSIMDYGDGKFALRIITERGAARLAKFACEYTVQRKRDGYPGKLTCVSKSNVLAKTDGIFDSAMEGEVKKYPDLSYERFYVDDTARRLLRYPKDFDVVVTSNLFGDILSDEASELIGGLGLAPSANVGGKVPYFESVHGSAPKYAGKNVINPTATLLSAKLMLQHLKMHREAKLLEDAIAAVFRDGKSLTQDQGGKATTSAFAEAVLKKIT
jgi:isocitrate/isopropylmalate dehydrogenase